MKVLIFRISTFLLAAVLLLLQLAEVPAVLCPCYGLLSKANILQARRRPRDGYGDNYEPPRKHRHKDQPSREIKDVTETVRLRDRDFALAVLTDTDRNHAHSTWANIHGHDHGL
jgi:hypothetical protein